MALKSKTDTATTYGVFTQCLNTAKNGYSITNNFLENQNAPSVLKGKAGRTFTAACPASCREHGTYFTGAASGPHNLLTAGDE